MWCGVWCGVWCGLNTRVDECFDKDGMGGGGGCGCLS